MFEKIVVWVLFISGVIHLVGWISQLILYGTLLEPCCG
jgi:hypothetical protein